MITEQDYLAYLSEIEVMEMNMREMYGLALLDIKDPAVRKVFEDLHKAEQTHGSLVKELRGLVSKKIIKNM